MKIIFFIVTLTILSSCNSLSDDFFEFLFNSKDIQLNRQCYDTPSIFSEGKFSEIYSMEQVNDSIVSRNIYNNRDVTNNKYSKYNAPKWHTTPVYRGNDSVYLFIQREMANEKNKCFDEITLTNILRQSGNYYTFLYDNLNNVKLFIWDTKKKQLLLLTSYEL